MSLLTIIQQVTDTLGLSRPTAVIGNTDQTTRSLLALANEEGRALKARHEWPELFAEGTFTTVADQEAYLITDIATDIDHIISDTVWNRSDKERIVGAISQQAWQAEKGWGQTSPFYRFTIVGKNIRLTPSPAGSEEVYFAYLSNNWCQSSGGIGQSAWAADTDTGVIPENIMELGIKWRFLKSKGFEYGADNAEYEQQLKQRIARDGPHMRLAMDYEPSNFWDASRCLNYPDSFPGLA